MWGYSILRFAFGELVGWCCVKYDCSNISYQYLCRFGCSGFGSLSDLWALVLSARGGDNPKDHAPTTGGDAFLDQRDGSREAASAEKPLWGGGVFLGTGSFAVKKPHERLFDLFSKFGSPGSKMVPTTSPFPHSCSTSVDRYRCDFIMAETDSSSLKKAKKQFIWRTWWCGGPFKARIVLMLLPLSMCISRGSKRCFDGNIVAIVSSHSFWCHYYCDALIRAMTCMQRTTKQT